MYLLYCPAGLLTAALLSCVIYCPAALTCRSAAQPAALLLSLACCPAALPALLSWCSFFLLLF